MSLFEIQRKHNSLEKPCCDSDTRKGIPGRGLLFAVWILASLLTSVSFPRQTGLSGNLIVLSVLYKGGLLMGSAHMTVGELSSFLMYAFWVGVSIGGI